MFSILAAARPCIPTLIVSRSVLPFQTKLPTADERPRGARDREEEEQEALKKSGLTKVSARIKIGVFGLVPALPWTQLLRRPTHTLRLLHKLCFYG